MAFKEFVSPLLDHIDSETAHIGAKKLAHFVESSSELLEFAASKTIGSERVWDRRLAVTIGEREKAVYFDRSGFLAAGWDKTGESVGFWNRFGANVVVGTVLPFSQRGNDKPRQFYRDGRTLNRLGFNSPGAEVVAGNLARYKDSGIPIVVSVGANKELVGPEWAPKAHALAIEKVYPHAKVIKYGVSSPNTTGLRDQQSEERLREIVQAGNDTMDSLGGRLPWLIKIAPDLSFTQLEGVIKVVKDEGGAGLAIGNTTIRDDLKAHNGWAGEMG